MGVIWCERNVRVFNQKEESLQHLLDKIKLQSYWWLKANKINFVFNYYLWWLNLLACLGIWIGKSPPEDLAPSTKYICKETFPRQRTHAEPYLLSRLKHFTSCFGGLVDRVNPDKRHNVFHKGSDGPKRPSKGPKQAKAAPL